VADKPYATKSTKTYCADEGPVCQAGLAYRDALAGFLRVNEVPTRRIFKGKRFDGGKY